VQGGRRNGNGSGSGGERAQRAPSDHSPQKGGQPNLVGRAWREEMQVRYFNCGEFSGILEKSLNFSGILGNSPDFSGILGNSLKYLRIFLISLEFSGIL
jgi:hypothetical protein